MIKFAYTGTLTPDQVETLPDWYGISGIKFWYRGTNDDPRIYYRGRLVGSAYIVEDTMWERFREDQPPFKDFTEELDAFEAYMRDNQEDVLYLCEVALGDDC